MAEDRTTDDQLTGHGRHTPASPYTVYEDAALAGASPAPSTPATPDTRARRRFDPFALLVGLVSLAVAVLAVVAPATLASVDPRWVLAGAAVVVGAGALLATARRRRH